MLMMVMTLFVLDIRESYSVLSMTPTTWCPARMLQNMFLLVLSSSLALVRTPLTE